jgi:outer membrane biosynthesis protein TonB
MRLSHIVVSLPLLLCASQLSQPISMAHAGMNATQATELLAKSHAIDAKCSVLSADQSQALRDFVARAEISLAEQASVSVARKTIASGKSQGKLATCDEAAKRLVNDVLAAANVATAAPIDDQTTAVEPEPQPEPAPQSTAAPTIKAVAQPAPAPEPKVVAAVEPEPTVKAKPIKSAKIVKPKTLAPNVKVAKAIKVAKPAKPEKVTKLSKPASGLQTYAAVAEKYYVASRCGSMSASQINALYKKVLANHRQALSGNRPSAVRSMLQSAEARAGSKSCG